MINKNIALAFAAICMIVACNARPEDNPLADARWIGTSERVLYSDFLPQFTVSADFSFAPGSSRASILFGANDPRLMDADLNIMGVANAMDESFVRVELDREAGCLNVYRTGYTVEDVPGKVFQTIDVADSLLTGGTVNVSVDATFSELRFKVGGVMVGQSNVGPLGHGGDYITYPQLSDLGWMVETDQTARVSNIEVREIRKPNALLYSNAGMAEASSGVKCIVEPSHGGMPLLRSSIRIKDKAIASATLYATARGVYEFSINGFRVGEYYLAPGLSQYNRHHYYQTYDVTDMLRAGDNEISAALAEGWWSGEQTFGSRNRNYFGDQLALLACLEVRYADGRTTRLVTDSKRWEVTTDSPVRYASLFQGQVTDARMNTDNAVWHSSEEMSLDGHTSDQTFGATAPRTDEYGEWQLLPQPDPSPRCYTVLEARSVCEVRPGVYVYDMGQNFAGVPSVTLRGLTAGQQLRFRFAEVLYPSLPEYRGNEGMLMLENIRGAMAQDIYIASGASEELFEPHFTFHGYRYLEITGVDEAPSIEDVKGLAISSVHDFTAHYECSNALVNRLWDNIRWSMLSNFLSIPTDCPQRNERMGWSGDISVFSRTATYLSNVDAFLTRHTTAIRDSQMPDGRMPDVAPIGGAFGGMLWGSAGITVPYECYRQYADTAILSQNYDAMKRYMTYIAENYIDKETGLMTQGNRRGFGALGDWLGPQNGQLDNSAIWDAYYIFDLQIMAGTASVLGFETDAAMFERLISDRKKEFAGRYFDPATGRFVASNFSRASAGKQIHIQSSYVLPLAFGIIDDPALRAKVIDNLVDTILHPGVADNGTVCPPYSLMTGFITTAWISKALSDNGRSDMAYRLLTQTTYPSWLYPVIQGATTIWERLDSFTLERGFGGNNSMNSFNHYSFGAVGQWLIANSLGIDRDPSTPGFRLFVLHPEADPTGSLTWARGWYDTPCGRISSSWKMVDGAVEYEFSIPEGCTATLRLPGMPDRELAAGDYEFRI